MNVKQRLNKLILICIAIFLGVSSCFMFEDKRYTYMSIALLGLFSVVVLIFINKFDIEKVITILFVLFIPFMTELNINYINDFHIVSKVYYRFNYLHLFCVYFLIKIIQNRKKINKGLDLLLLGVFNVVCIIGSLNALNFKAFFFDYIRYFSLSIVYIYFSRIFDFKKYKDIIYKYLFIGIALQLLLGMLQKIKGSSLGLTILGEGFEVFRMNVGGYEKGFSGTFGHPGPMALYANYILIIFLFNKNIKKIIRILGVIISSLVVILAAGRTSMLIMGLIFVIYAINELIEINIKSIIISFISILGSIIGIVFFSDKLSPLISRFLDSDMQFQYQNRLSHLYWGIRYIEQHYILGLGLNNYLDNTYRDYPISFESNFYLSNPIHNAFILYAVEVGLIGLAVFCLFLINNFIMYNKIRKKLRIEEKYVLKGTILVIVVWCIYALQGWGGIQTRSLLILFMSCSLIYNRYKYLKNI